MSDEPVQLVCNPCTIPPGTEVRRGRCQLCRRPIWIAKVQIMKVPDTAVAICGPCALSDPLFRAFTPPEVLEELTKLWMQA